MPIRFVYYECKPLDGYKFPVYSTKQCPRNQTEWNERSSAINCTEGNGYVCLPNENITELLEFCYIYPFILIEEGICLYLNKRYSAVDSYRCTGFLSGCPNASFVSNDLFKNPKCTSIGNGCFLAEPACQSVTSTTYLQNTTEKNRLEDITTLIASTCVTVVLIITCASFLYFLFKHKKGHWNCIKNEDTEKQEEEEHLPLISKNQCDKDLSPDQGIIDEWKEGNKQFVETKASKEVENLTNSQNLVVVTGDVGSGKSAIVQNIALKYINEGWTVKPVYTIKDMIKFMEKCNLQNKYVFVLNDPIGVESFDEVKFNSLRTYEEYIEACLKKVKLLMTCRLYILSDNRVKGLLKNKSNIVDISNDQNALRKEEKQKILIAYAVNENISSKQLDDILETKHYFPLLCKSYFSKQIDKSKVIEYFQEPREFYENQIKEFRQSCHTKYCALVLLVLFNNGLCIEDIWESKVLREKYNLALDICKIGQNTAPHTIIEALETLQRFFVKKIGNTYHFFHDLLMEITTVVFGRDYPLQTIKHVDIGFLRKRVKLSCINDKSDEFTIYLSDKHIDPLGKRLFNEIFGERVLDVVHNPCLKNKDVINVFIKELESKPKNLEMLLERITINFDQQAAEQPSTRVYISKLDLLGMKETISPLNAIIIFCDTRLSIHCLKAVQKLPNYTKDNSLFSSVCCNGSMDLFALFENNEIREYLSEKWDSLYPIHIASAFNNNEILKELFNIGANVNLKTTNDNCWTPLTLAAGNNAAEENEDNATNTRSRRNDTVQLLLDNEADVNLCMEIGASPLYEACQEGKIEIVELLLAKKADINLCIENGISPLSIACQKKHENIVQLLLVHGADINLYAKNGSSPLYVACQQGLYNIVQLFLERGANINICVDDGTSPLYIACKEGHDKIVEHLIENGADIHLCKKSGANALFIACQNGHSTIVEQLVCKGADTNMCMKDGTSPLIKACQFGHLSIVKTLIRYKADVNQSMKNKSSPLFMACQNGHERIAKLLLEKGANINCLTDDRHSPLYIACEKGHNDLIKLLLRNGGDISNIKNGGGPLFSACKNGLYEIVQRLLENGADINQCDGNGLSPLSIACQKKEDEIVQYLLRNSADINLCSKNGRSPLYVACKFGNESAVQILLRNSADVNHCNEENSSPLYIACQQGHKNIVNLLLMNGADTSLCRNDGRSSLVTSCQKEYHAIVQLLLENGADVNLCMDDRRSPLYIACSKGNDKIVNRLLRHKADINLCLKNGESPLYVACKKGYNDIVNNLLKNGADIGLCMKNETCPFYIACQEGHFDIVKLLLNKDADLHLRKRNGESPLIAACRNGHYKIVEYLFDKGAEINICLESGASLLSIACEKGHANFVQWLLHKKANINLCMKNGASPLYMACQEEHEAIVKLLLANKANTNSCLKNSKYCPLYIACENGNKNIVELLLNNGANVNLCIDEDGPCPLHIACQKGHYSIVTILLNIKADINQRKKNGETPLYEASREGHAQVVKYLLTNGADINLCNENGTSPYDIASQNGNGYVTKMFEDNSAVKKL